MSRERIDRRVVLKCMAGAPLVAAAMSALPLARARGEERPLYRDASATVAERVQDLLGRMTLEEKVAQMIALWQAKADIMNGLEFVPGKATAAYPDGFGQVTRPSDKRGAPGTGMGSGGSADRWRTPQETVAFINAIQHWAVENTRLGIPVLMHEESLHGYMATEATMFPQAIALAGSFDRELMHDVSSVIAREVRARGVHLVLSPVVDIVRDPRWGRIEETFGEDPYLVSEMGVAAVEGLQGRGKFETLAPDKVFATLKHMTGHGQPASGNNVSPAQISERELRENFFPPFRSVVERTSIGAVMPSYNEIDGMPSHANRWLLQDVLRDEWGFDGVIVSDFNGVEQLETLHHVTADGAESARRALAAGVDSETPNGDTYRSLVQQIEDGNVEESAIDSAVARIIEFKIRAGLFESPYGDAALTARITGNEEARELARKAARKSLCLLSNDGTLPLALGANRTIAVIGPNAAISRLGGYSSVPKQDITLLQGIREIVAGNASIVTAQGVLITQSDDRSVDEILLGDPGQNLRLIDQAVAVATNADVIVLAIGDT
jgi:beta-glucosidase